MTKVAICIATYKRPQMLDDLLTSLSKLRFVKNKPLILSIIVVDNDPDGTGMAVTEKWKKKLVWPLLYAIEKCRGIPFVRNRSVAMADQSDFVAFVDDDECVDELWLDELLSTQVTYNADLVAGPVIPRFMTPPAQWFIHGRFFERQRFPTGTERPYAGAGNLLIRKILLDSIQGPFDEQTGGMGGEDTLLTSTLKQRHGARIVWDDHAIVEEWVPPSRVSVNWLLKRAYREGISYSFCQKKTCKGHSWRLVRSAKGLAKIMLGLLKLVTGLFRGKAVLLHALQLCFLGAGDVAGIFNLTYSEYNKIHGQ